MQGRIGLLSTDNNSGSLKGGQQACNHASVCVYVFLLAYLLHIEYKNLHSTSKVRTFLLVLALFLGVKNWF